MIKHTERTQTTNMNRERSFQYAAIEVIETVTEAVLVRLESHTDYCKIDNWIA